MNGLHGALLIVAVILFLLDAAFPSQPEALKGRAVPLGLAFFAASFIFTAG